MEKKIDFFLRGRYIHNGTEFFERRENMELFTPAECAENYVKAGRGKAQLPLGKMFALAALAGVFIAVAGAATNTAVHTVSNVGAARTVIGLLFPFGLAMVILMGAELFTGNTLMVMSALERQVTVGGLLRNWCVVYLGNVAGAVLVAAGCAFGGQLNYSGGQLAVFAMRLAAGKCVLPLGNAVISGILCNILVTTAILMSMSGKDLAGRVIGAYLPVAFFAMCGFEHCIANLFYVPVALFAKLVPTYAALAAEAGVDLEALTLGNFLLRNLLPVTVGNIIGGVGLGSVYWWCHRKKKK